MKQILEIIAYASGKERVSQVALYTNGLHPPIAKWMIACGGGLRFAVPAQEGKYVEDFYVRAGVGVEVSVLYKDEAKRLMMRQCINTGDEKYEYSETLHDTGMREPHFKREQEGSVSTMPWY